MYLSHSVPAFIEAKVAEHFGLDAQNGLSMPGDLPSVACSHDGGAKNAIICRVTESGDLVLNYLSPSGYYSSYEEAEEALSECLEDDDMSGPGYSIEEITVQMGQFNVITFKANDEPEFFDSLGEALIRFEGLTSKDETPEPM